MRHAFLPLAFPLLFGCQINERVDGILELESDAAAGAVVYAEECAECHGDDGRGNEIGPNLVAELHHGDRLFLTYVLDGFGSDMPAFPELTDQEAADLMAHIHALADG